MLKIPTYDDVLITARRIRLYPHRRSILTIVTGAELLSTSDDGGTLVGMEVHAL